MGLNTDPVHEFAVDKTSSWASAIGRQVGLIGGQVIFGGRLEVAGRGTDVSSNNNQY